MKNQEIWAPSKYIRIGDRLSVSNDPRAVSVGSRLMARKVAEFFSEAIPLYARGRLLDLGCGSAPLFELYRDFASEIVCLDWGGSVHGCKYLDIEHDLNQALPFEDAQFDTVILSDVLEHIREPQQLWIEISRVLASGGRLLLNVPFFYWLHERPYDFYRYTEFALRRFAECSRLEIIDLRHLGGAPEILCDIVSKVVSGYRFGKPVAAAVQKGGGWLVNTRPGMRLSNRTAPRFPFGYALVAQKA